MNFIMIGLLLREALCWFEHVSCYNSNHLNNKQIEQNNNKISKNTTDARCFYATKYTNWLIDWLIHSLILTR